MALRIFKQFRPTAEQLIRHISSNTLIPLSVDNSTNNKTQNKSKHAMHPTPNWFQYIQQRFKYVPKMKYCEFECTKTCPTVCPDKTCHKKKKTLWQKLFHKEKKEKLEDCCVVTRELKDPDLSEFGGKVYRTCGRAYVVQKDMANEHPYQQSREEQILRKIECHPDLKDTINEPIPNYTSVAHRLLDVSDNKCHPLYLKLRATPKQQSTHGKVCKHTIHEYDIPLRININKELLEQKNIFCEYKRAEPPRQFVGRILDVQRDKNAMEYRRTIGLDPYKKLTEQKKFVFETLKGQSDCL